MAKKNQIGLDQDKSKSLAEKLNMLLSDYQLFYINARGFHWNIAGDKFFELRVKFEEIYTDALVKIEEIAESILTLSHTPFLSFTSYVKTSSIKEATNIADGKEAVGHVLTGFQELLKAERELLSLSAEANDEGTNALMSNHIREKEKPAWMYTAFLKNK